MCGKRTLKGVCKRMPLEVITGGALTTVQDLGRFGYAAQGFGSCGACDKHALRLANALLGNSLGLSALECTLQGATVRFLAPCMVAVAGADPAVTLNGKPAAAYRPLRLAAGDVLAVGTVSGGVRSYLAVQGGFALPPVMGSQATDLRAHIGGMQGRALKAGDVLPTAALPAKHPPSARKLARRLAILNGWGLAAWMAHTHGAYRFMGGQRVALVRAVAGPQTSYFTQAGQDTFTRSIYCVGVDSNRMACRMEGSPIQAHRGYDILSDGIAEGAVQVSANGLPIVMLADHQTTGGYAKIATVISVDIPTLAQLRPGDSVAFRMVPPEEGIRAARAEHALLCKIKELMTL